jgi:hypothetical protein
LATLLDERLEAGVDEAGVELGATLERLDELGAILERLDELGATLERLDEIGATLERLELVATELFPPPPICTSIQPWKRS